MTLQPDADHPYPPNPVADAAWEIYQSELRHKLEPEHHGKAVFIDIKSHDYEIEDGSGGELVHLQDRHPDAVCYCYRIGYPIWWTREIHPIEELLAEPEENFPPAPELTPEVIAERKRQADAAQALYENEIRPKLAASDKGKFLALDPATGDYEIDANMIRAIVHLRDRQPDAEFVFQFRVGYRLQARLTPVWCEE